MPDLLWFLLPVAAFSGWWVAQRQHRETTGEQRSQAYSSGYYEGLNYLLNEQPDKALEVFVRSLPVSGETVEIHLALGSLFRRRGEIDRAIVLHQNLLEQPGLNSRQREQVMFELAQDHLSAGLLDRAEELFLELKRSRSHAQAALRLLIDVYQQEKDWVNAISAAYQYADITGERQDFIIAHYYCELAEQALAEGRERAAGEFVAKALQADGDSVRAALIMARMAIGREDCQAAVKHLQRVLQRKSPYVSEILALLVTCYEHLGWRERIPSLLAGVEAPADGVFETLALARLCDRYGENARARRLLEALLDRKPDSEVLSCYLELLGERFDCRSTLDRLKRLLRQRAELAMRYLCSQCGFSGQELHWQCPSCKSWGTIRPL